jgi:hypothetical protein
MKSYKHLVKHALKNGHTISVFDEEVWQVKRGTAYQEIISAIESVEAPQIRIRDQDGDIVGWALIIPFLDDDETVADYSCTDFLESWNKTYSM